MPHDISTSRRDTSDRNIARELNGLGPAARSPQPDSLELAGRELCASFNGDQEGGGGGNGGCGGEEDALAFFSSLSEDIFSDTPVSRIPAIAEGAVGPEKRKAVTLALPAPPPVSDGLHAAMEQVEVAFEGEDPATLECGGLSKGEVMDMLSKVENFMESKACDTAKLIGVSDVGVDKGLKSSLLLIKRRWLADIARKAKCDVASKTGTSKI